MMPRILKAADRALTLIEDWSLLTAMILALVIALLNIFLRKLTPISLYWSDEVVRTAIYFTTYIGFSVAIRKRALIRVDALPQLIPILKKPLTLLNHLAVLGFSVFIFWIGLKYALVIRADEYALTSSLQIPEWILYSVLPLAGLLGLVRGTTVILEDLFAKPHKHAAGRP